MGKPYLYIAEVAHDAVEPQVCVARLVSRLRGLDQELSTRGKTPEEADQALRKALGERLRRECYPINVHVLPEGYYCCACMLLLPTRAACTEHRRRKHALTSSLP